MKKSTLFFALTCALAVCSCAFTVGAQRRRGDATVCGDPVARCVTVATFEVYDLPFRLRRNVAIWESESFYAVVLKSVSVGDEWGECERFIPEGDRLEAQKLFPRHKVFASRCGEPGSLYYTGVNPKQRFMAVYAGRTRADADAVLARVKAAGKYPGANVRRLRAGFNGT